MQLSKMNSLAPISRIHRKAGQAPLHVQADITTLPHHNVVWRNAGKKKQNFPLQIATFVIEAVESNNISPKT